jgi:hypothetical protein
MWSFASASEPVELTDSIECRSNSRRESWSFERGGSGCGDGVAELLLCAAPCGAFGGAC